MSKYYHFVSLPLLLLVIKCTMWEDECGVQVPNHSWNFWHFVLPRKMDYKTSEIMW